MTEPSRVVCSGAGLRLAVYEQGPQDGPTVLLVHGYPDSARMFDGMATVLARRFRVVRYDVRGAGRSDAPPTRSGYRLDALVTDLAAVVRATGGEPVHLVGHDWGSVQSWQAVTEPGVADLFASYTTISGPCLAHVAHWMRRAGPGQLLDQALRSWYIAAFQLPVLPDAVAALAGRRRREAVNGLALYRENMLTQARTPTARRTDVPVQQIALTRDPFIRPDLLRSADPWCSRLYRRSLRAGHWAPRDQPERVAGMVTEFVDYLDGLARPIDLTRVGAA